MKLLFLTLGLSWFSIVAAQITDTTIFNSDFEKQVFKNYLKKSPVKTLDLLLVAQHPTNVPELEKLINDFATGLEKKGFNEYNRKKQMKTIYDQVHSRFLKKYEEEAYFADIFSNGNYNCVTASALYALVLDYFKIDYIIKETPNHVFLVADPNSTSYLFETTLPANGVMQFSDRFKKNYIDYLRNNKIISETEYKTNSFDDLFQKHYESSKVINQAQLAALQYYNKGIFDFNAERYALAAINFEKADLIYPSLNIRFLLSSSLQNQLADQTEKKQYDGKTFAKFVSLNLSNVEGAQLSTNHFRALTNEMVINRPNIAGYTSFYADFTKNVGDSVDIKEYEQIYHESLAYYYQLTYNFEKVFDHASMAYKANPENIRNRQIVLESLLNYLREGDKMDEITIDSLTNYTREFPFLVNNDVYLRLLSYGFTSDIAKGGVRLTMAELEKNIDRMEKFSKQLLVHDSNDDVVEKLFSESAAVLVRDYNYDDAERVLKKGLEIVPGSDNLKQQLSTISRSKDDMKKYMRNSQAQVPSSLLITPPPYKDEEVYASVKKYLGKCWKVDFFKKDGKTRETKVEQLSFIFMPNNKMKFKTGNEEHWGTWKLIESGPTLTLKSNEDKQQLTILIYEASATQMRGIMSPYKVENKKIEFNVCEK
jgi:hypothetical protein